ncbi:YdcH family protein [Thiofilum flexile]|uniref:YdcH family protein n=1 Tax=Thiofilum flexile TaxID=125627 RepID=UPI0003797527|nr:YdcH family protein [Thiofilum flexile]
MFGESHNLADELPEFKDKISQLKTENNHFTKLFGEYDEVVHQLHRVEQGIEVHADAVVEELKLKRLHLKDALYDMLKKA